MMAAVLGWLGTLGTFATYLLVTRGVLTIASFRYAVFNAVGGSLGGVAAYMYGAWPSVAANFAWTLVAVHSLWLYFRRGAAPQLAAGEPAGPVSERGDQSDVPAVSCAAS